MRNNTQSDYTGLTSTNKFKKNRMNFVHCMIVLAGNSTPPSTSTLMIKTQEILEVEKSASETAEKTHHWEHGDKYINK